MLKSTTSRRATARRTPPRRLTKAERSEQLLDAAAELVAEHGLDAVTMERVAARAGVSKALPYQHFADSTALLVALKDRELSVMAERTVEAMDTVDDFEEKIARAIETGFTTMDERGSILITLVFADLPEGDQSARGTRSPIVDVLEHELGLRPKVAAAVDGMITLSMAGAYIAWTDRVASRKAIEAIAVRMIVAGATAVADADKHGRLPR